MLLGFLGGLLGTVLIGFAWTNISASTIRNRQAVTGWLDRSNFYSQAADIALENIEKTTVKDGGEGLPFSDPNVKAVVKNALSSDFVKNSVDSFIGSIYQWLGSSDQDLMFKLDLNPIKTQIVDGLTAYAKTRSAGLPKCGAVDGNSPVDPLAATCLPAGVSADKVASMAHDYVAGQKLFKTPVVLGSDIMVSQSGKKIPITSDSKLVAARKAYKLGGFLPIGLGITTLLLSLAIIFLSKKRLQGMHRVGNIFLTIGFGLLIIYAGLRYFFNWGTKRLASLPGGLDSHQKLGVDLVRVILTDVERYLLIFTVAYIVVGVIVKVVAVLIKRHHRHKDIPVVHEAPMSNNVPPARDLTPAEPRPLVPSAPPVPQQQRPPRPPRPPRKIQL